MPGTVLPDNQSLIVASDDRTGGCLRPPWATNFFKGGDPAAWYVFANSAQNRSACPSTLPPTPDFRLPT